MKVNVDNLRWCSNCLSMSTRPRITFDAEGWCNACLWTEQVIQDDVGELYLNSMDQDGTGQGYDLQLLDLLPANMPKPVILAGGVGNATHLAAGLADPRVDAVATAHLFNFIGNGLKQARQALISGGVNLPLWDIELLEQHLGDEQACEARLD